MNRRFLPAASAARFPLALTLAVTLAAPAASGAALGFERPADAFEPSPGFRLGAPAGEEPPASARPPVETPPVETAPAPPSPKRPRLFDAKTTAITAGVVLGAPVVGYFTWWRVDSSSTFSFANERWFQVYSFPIGFPFVI